MKAISINKLHKLCSWPKGACLALPCLSHRTDKKSNFGAEGDKPVTKIDAPAVKRRRQVGIGDMAKAISTLRGGELPLSTLTCKTFLFLLEYDATTRQAKSPRQAHISLQLFTC